MKGLPVEESDVFSRLKQGLDSTKPPVVIFRANDICSMGLARGVDAVGFDTVWIHYKYFGAPIWFSEKSKHWKHTYQIENPATEPEIAASKICKLGHFLRTLYQQKILIMMSSDTVQNFFFTYEEKFSQYFDMYGHQSYYNYRKELTDKGVFFRKLAQTLPQLCPKTEALNNKTNLKAVYESFNKPFLIKPAIKDPAQSFYKLNSGKKALEITELNIFTQIVERYQNLNIPLIAQQLINYKAEPNEVPFYCYFDKAHDLRLAAAGKKVLIQPEIYGTATVLKLTHHTVLEPLARKIGKALRWSGPLMIEFMQDNETKQWQVIEINTRPWLFHDFYRQNHLPFIGAAVLEHFDFHNGTNLLQSLLQSQSLISPKTLNLKETNTVHLDLLSVLTFVSDRVTANSGTTHAVIEKINQFGDTISFAHGNSKDNRPLEHALQVGAKKFNLDPSKLRSWINEKIREL